MRFTMWAAASAVLLAGPVRADDPSPYAIGEVFLVDELRPLPADGRIPLSIQVGPVDFTEIRIEDMPSELEVSKATRNSEKSRVEPVVTIEGVEELGRGMETRVVIHLTLEDEAGAEVIACVKTVDIDPGDSDQVSVCTLGARTLYTQDWPKVKNVHLRAKLNIKR